MKHLRNITLLFGLVCSVMLATPTYATSRVQFEGGAEDFVFYPDGEWTETDLFGGLQGVMPGDVRTETIEIKNTASEYDYVKIYLRAVPHDDNNPISAEVAESGETIATMTDFLKQLEMTVKNGEQIISQSSAADPGGLINNVLIGSFQKGSGTTLTVSIEVPEELEDEYQYRVGEVDWVWTAEGYTDATAPDTGKEHEIEIRAAGVITTLLALVIVGYICYRKVHR